MSPHRHVPVSLAFAFKAGGITSIFESTTPKPITVLVPSALGDRGPLNRVKDLTVGAEV
jgi:hypothetical protein